MDSTHASAFPFRPEQCVSRGASLPVLVVNRVRREAERRGVSLRIVMYDAVKGAIDQLEAEPRTRTTARLPKHNSGSTALNYSLPAPLFARLRAVADSIIDPTRMQFTGNLAYVLRRCIVLHLPDASGDAIPKPPPVKEPPVASALMVVPVPPAVHKWLQDQPSSMSAQVRRALQDHLDSVCASDKLGRRAAPVIVKGGMVSVPVRVPETMRDKLRTTGLERSVGMSAIVRVCIALYIKAQIAGAPAAPSAAPTNVGRSTNGDRHVQVDTRG